MNNFICKKKIGIWMVCLCLVIGCIWKTDYTYAKEDADRSEAKVKLEVVVGYDGNQVRYTKKNRAVATLTNVSSETIDGVVKLSLPAGSEDAETLIEQQVHLEPKKEVEVDLSFVSADIFRTVNIYLEDTNGKKIAEKETVVKRLYSSNIVYGILSKNSDSLKYFSEESEGKSIVFQQKDFPDCQDWLDIVDVLLVGDFYLETLDAEQQAALTNWVKDGGTVVIGNAGKESLKNLEILGIKATKNKNELTVTGVSGTYYKDADLIIYPIEDERGAYIVCSKSIEFANTELVKKSACVAATGEYYGDTAALCLYPDYSNEGYYGESSSAVDKDSAPLVWVIVVLLIIYVLFITVVLRFVLKKKDKLEYMWGIIPLCAFIFMGIVYVIGTHSRVSNVQMSYHTVVEYDESDDKGKALTCVSLVSPSNQSYAVNIPDGMEVWNADAYEESVDVLEEDVRKEMNIDKENGTVTFQGNTSFEKNNLYGAYEVEKAGEYESSITCMDYKYEGTFTNHMGITMKNACFLAGKRVYYLGDIADGETININEKRKNALLYNAMDLYENIQAKKWLSFGQKNGKYGLGYKYLPTVCNYLNSYSYVERITEPKILYVTEEEGTINSQWGVEDMVGYTVNVLNIDVDYTQGEETFLCDILYSKNTEEIYTYIGNDSSMEYVLTYQFGENETLTSLKYLETPNNFGKDTQVLQEEMATYPFEGRIELYNYSTADYETVFVQPGQELSKKEVTPYIGEDNKIKIRLVSDFESAEGEYVCQYVPVISATVKEAK